MVLEIIGGRLTRQSLLEFTLGRLIRRSDLLRDQWLFPNQLARESRMFDEMPDEQVPATASQPAPPDRFCGELSRETIEEFDYRLERVKHLSITRRRCVPALDDVPTVWAPSTDCVDKDRFAGQCVCQFVTDSLGPGLGELDRGILEVESNVTIGLRRVDGRTIGEFLDQESEYSVSS